MFAILLFFTCQAEANDTSYPAQGARQDASDGEVFIRRGSEHVNIRDWNAAIKEFSEGLRLEPENAMLYEYRGSAFAAKGDWEEAIRDFTSAIQFSSANARAYFNRASVYRSSGNYELALADVNASLRFSRTNAWAYKLRAALRSFNGHYAQAVGDWNAGLKLDPNDANALACRGSDYAAIGEFRKSIQDYYRAVQLDDTCDLAYNNLAWLRATCVEPEFRDAKEAISAATRACELTKWMRWDWIDTLAAAYAEAGDFDKAIKYQNQAMAMNASGGSVDDEASHRLSMYQQRRAYREKVKANSNY